MMVAVVMVVESLSSSVLQRRSARVWPHSGDAQAPQYSLDLPLSTADVLVRESMGTAKTEGTHLSK
jgi:hypothetical protein